MSTTAEDRTGIGDRRMVAGELAASLRRSCWIAPGDRREHTLELLATMAAEDGTRPLANSALELLETGCATAEDALSGDDAATAMQTLVALCQRLVGLLEPYAGPREAGPSSTQGVDID